MFWRKPSYPNKTLFNYLDILYEHHSNNKINFKNTYIIVDFDKTLIKRDALFKLIFNCLFSKGFKYIFLVINSIFRSISQIERIEDFKICFKYALSIGIVKNYDKASIEKCVLEIFVKYKRDNLFRRLKNFNDLGIKTLVATNNYEYFLKELLEGLNFEFVGNEILNLNDHKKYAKDKITRIEEYLGEGKNILASISDSLVDKKMLELASNEIYIDYKSGLFFTIKKSSIIITK